MLLRTTHVLALVLVAGFGSACRDSPTAPSSGPTLNDLVVRSSEGQGSEIGNRVLYPQRRGVTSDPIR